MDKARSYSTPMLSGKQLSAHDGDVLEDVEHYRSVVGALQYLTITRPKIAFSVNKLCQLSVSLRKHIGKPIKGSTKIFKGTTNFGLFLEKRIGWFFMALLIMIGQGADRRSCCGYFVLFCPNLLSWSLQKQLVVA